MCVLGTVHQPFCFLVPDIRNKDNFLKNICSIRIIVRIIQATNLNFLKKPIQMFDICDQSILIDR